MEFLTSTQSCQYLTEVHPECILVFNTECKHEVCLFKGNTPQGTFLKAFVFVLFFPLFALMLRSNACVFVIFLSK